jgi:hypothetical protein
MSCIRFDVVQAIIHKTGYIWHGFAFLFATCLAPLLVIWLTVDVPKLKVEWMRTAAWYCVYDIYAFAFGRDSEG